MDTFFIGRQICTADSNCDFLQVSDSLLALLGCSENELFSNFGKSLFDIMHPQTRALAEAAVSYVLATKDPMEFDSRLDVDTDQETWIHCSLAFGQDPESPECFTCDIADITKYHAIATYYKSMLNSLENPLIITDTDKRVWFMNTAAEQASGMTLEECIGVSCASFNTPYCGTEDCCILRWKRGDRAAIQKTPDGKSNRVNYTSLKDERGKEIGYVSVSTDITELIETERKLQLSEERYRLALAQTHDAIWEYDVVTDTLHQSQEQAFTEKDYLDFGPSVQDASRRFSESNAFPPDSKTALQGMFNDIWAGKKTTQCLIQVKNKDGNLRWVQIICTIICDTQGRPLRVIAISKDVTNEKQREMEFEQERQYRNSMTHDAITSYEINLTKDQIIYADPYWLSQLNADTNIAYSKLMELTAEKVVNHRFRQQMLDTIGRDALLESYRQGKRDIQFEYLRRIIQNDNDEIWVCTSVSLIETKLTGDICAFIYIKDIDQQKRQELELRKNAERDVLTGLFNRKTVTTLIEQALEKLQSDKENALLMIDIDNFKEINDSYGHLYGDAVLSDIAYKLKKSINKQDLVGRLGGDEFIALLWDYPSKDALLEKIEQIKTTLEMVYSSGNNDCNISGSIGIVFTPEYGSDFNTLYGKADIALYDAKIKGRNRYSVYNPQMATSAKSSERPLPGMKENRSGGKNFIDHISEYVFRILFMSENLELGISSILELISRHYEAQRSYIFGYDANDDTYSMRYEWVDKGVESSADWMNRRITKVPKNYEDYFASNGLLVIEDTTHASEDIQSMSDHIGTKSYLQSAMVIGGSFKGFIGVDYAKEQRTFSKDEIETLKTIAEVIGTFLQNKQHEDEAKRYIATIQTVLDNITLASYVVNPRTYELAFINKRTLAAAPDAKIGDICYKRFLNYETPCPFCPIQYLTDDFNSSYKISRYNEFLGKWLEIAVNNVKWPDGEIYCMVNSIDITQYIEKNHK